jgi:two-component system chemotaxis response regulator CheB
MSSTQVSGRLSPGIAHHRLEVERIHPPFTAAGLAFIANAPPRNDDAMLDTARRDVIAIGASAGGFHVLMELAAQLPADFPAAVLIVLHIGSHPSELPKLLSARGPNPVVHPCSGQPLQRGTIYVAPPDHHMLLHGDSIHLSRGPREHHARPAIDPLFRSVAIACGSRAIGVVLSGRLDDGTPGAQAIKQCGGLIVVQDPDDSEQASMPSSVCENLEVDRCVPRAVLAETLINLVGTPAAAPVDLPAWLLCEQRVSEGEADPMEDLNRIGKPSVFACPDCDGVLWEVMDSKPKRFRCHTGHAFTLRTLEHTQATNTNKALWSAVRALQERESLLAALVADHRARRNDDEAARLEAELKETSQHSARLHEITVEE